MKKVLALAFLVSFVWAQVPRTMNYQGKLTDADGVAIDDTCTITFRIYNAPTDGDLLWYQTMTVNVVNGLFDVQLDLSINGGDTLKFDRPYWMALQVRSDPEMTPREKLAPVSYSFRSVYSTSVDSALQSVSSSANTTGRVGHIMFVPYESSSITESASNDTIYIAAIGGSSGSGSCPKIRRVRMTSSTYNGNLGGYSGANQKCVNEFGPGWHMCNQAELNSANVSSYQSYPAPFRFDYEYVYFGAYGWYAPTTSSSGTMGHTTYDCNTWASSSGTGYRAYIRRTNTTGNSLYFFGSEGISCSSSCHIWCCED